MSEMIDPKVFRDALSLYASGITIISGMVDGKPVGFTCQSFYSVSLEPPLISFSVMKTSTSWPVLRPAKQFAVHLLRDDQAHLSDLFAKRNEDRFSNADWTRSDRGNPIIKDTLLCLECTLYAEHEAGDHWIVLGKVDEISSATQPSAPLVYYRGRYRKLSLEA
jgi:3-hydroxy-9,10-secoandrosta-1,3,5(10)-triene-9,17-dione monooxygenase reductase component